MNKHAYIPIGMYKALKLLTSWNLTLPTSDLARTQSASDPQFLEQLKRKRKDHGTTLACPIDHFDVFLVFFDFNLVMAL
jgi:hypothetical protein